MKTSSGCGAEHMAREGVRDRQHIPVEVHTALRATRGAGGEGDQRDVVGRGPHGGVRLFGRPAAQQVVGGVTAVRRDPELRDLGLGEVVEGTDVAQGVPHLGDLAHRAQLVRALLGQHGDGDRAGLQYRQPAGGQPGGGGAAQQDTVAGDDPEVAGEGVREAVDAGAEVAVRPGPAGGRVEHRSVRGRPGEKVGGTVQTSGVVQLRQVEAELRPLVGGREMVAREGVDVGRGVHGGSPPCLVGIGGGHPGRVRRRRAYRVGDDSQRYAIPSEE
ncbi:hypothetical protein SALBM311S_01543 [Streptomyces alboniger]